MIAEKQFFGKTRGKTGDVMGVTSGFWYGTLDVLTGNFFFFVMV